MRSLISGLRTTCGDTQTRTRTRTRICASTPTLNAYFTRRSVTLMDRPIAGKPTKKELRKMYPKCAREFAAVVVVVYLFSGRLAFDTPHSQIETKGHKASAHTMSSFNIQLTSVCAFVESKTEERRRARFINYERPDATARCVRECLFLCFGRFLHFFSCVFAVYSPQQQQGGGNNNAP